jgi:regulator of sigma E protease
MDFIESAGGLLYGYGLPFLFVLAVVIFVHEFGHFIVARWCGVAVQTFSIGFGPELLGWTDRHGTRWRVAAIPLGGYVKFIDDMNAASVPSREALDAMPADYRAGAFQTKSVWRRAAIVVAGPAANFLLAIAVFTVLFAAYGRPVTPAAVDAVEPGSAAEAAGFAPGDLILSIDGAAIGSFGDMQRVVSGNADEPLDFVVRRGGGEVAITATPRRTTVEDVFGNEHSSGLLGIRQTSPEIEIVRYGPIEALGAGIGETWFVAERTLDYVGKVIVGRESPDQLGGPIRVAQMSGQVATLGLLALVNLVAILSVSIGLVNLFPVPLLDGGHLLFYAIEAVRGRPLSARVQDYGFRVGFVLVIMLMVFTTWNDILNLARS